MKEGEGLLCCSVLLNALAHMKEEAFILGLSRGCVHRFETHSHCASCTQTHTHLRTLEKRKAHKPIDRPDLPFYQSPKSRSKDVFHLSSETFSEA